MIGCLGDHLHIPTRPSTMRQPVLEMLQKNEAFKSIEDLHSVGAFRWEGDAV